MNLMTIKILVEESELETGKFSVAREVGGQLQFNAAQPSFLLGDMEDCLTILETLHPQQQFDCHS